MNIHLDMELEDSSALSSRSTVPFLSPPVNIDLHYEHFYWQRHQQREREEENSMADVTQYSLHARTQVRRTDGRRKEPRNDSKRGKERERKGNRLSAVQRSLTVV